MKVHPREMFHCPNLVESGQLETISATDKAGDF